MTQKRPEIPASVQNIFNYRSCSFKAMKISHFRNFADLEFPVDASFD